MTTRIRSAVLPAFFCLLAMSAVAEGATLTPEQQAAAQAYMDKNPDAMRSSSIPVIQRKQPTRVDTGAVGLEMDTLPALESARRIKLAKQRRKKMLLARQRNTATVASANSSAELDPYDDLDLYDEPDTALQRYGLKVFAEAQPDLFGPATGAVGPEYPIGPGDELILTMWGDRDARMVQTVDRDGQINFEGVGTVSLSGKTMAQAETLVRSRLGKVYSGMGASQHADLTLGKLKRIRVFVVGEVERPGAYFLSGNTSVLSALYMARGPSELGTERMIYVRRGGKEIGVDLYGVLFDGARPAEDVLRDGDVVRVPAHGALVTVRGAVKRPGIYEMIPSEPTGNILKYAGGLSANAAEQGLQVSRLFQNGRRDVLIYPSPTQLAAGATAEPFSDSDEVLVHEGRDPSRFSVAVSGAARFPGGYPWKPGMTAFDLLTLAGGPNDSAFDGRVLVKRQDTLGVQEVLRAPMSRSAGILLRQGDTLTVYNRRSMSDTDSVLISGAIRKPGRYRFRNAMTVKDLILEAGGFLPSAEFGRIRLEEALHDSALATTRWLDLDSSLAAEAADTPLEPGQHLAIPWNPRQYDPEAVMLQGWVRSPGLYFLKNPGERISSVLQRAGGIKDGGYARAAVFVRGRDSVGRVQIDLSKAMEKPGSAWDVPLRGNDTLTIPDKPATVRVSGYANYPTSIMYEEGRSWKWYVARAGGYADSADEDKVWIRYADGSILSKDYGLVDPDPGSEIVIPKAPPPETMRTAEKVQMYGSIAGTLLTLVTVIILIKSN